MGKTILVTGASLGIGAAIAKRFAKDNTIIVHYNTSEDEANEVAQFITGRGGTPILVQADVSTKEGCEKIIAACEKLGKLDGVVNNAGGIINRVPVDEASWEYISAICDLNITSVAFLTGQLVNLLKKSDDGWVTNISSVAAHSGGSVTAVIYAATKGAVSTYTKGAAKHLAPYIRVNAIAPGVIETPFHAQTPADMMQKFKDSCPLQKIGVPDDIAEAAWFLANNTFTTGATIDVNGGVYLR